MCAVQNFHIDWLIDSEREEEKFDAKNIGRRDAHRLYLRSDEITHISRKFLSLYQNRQDFLAKKLSKKHHINSIKTEKLGKKFAYRPEIGERNQRLAMHR